MEGDDKGEIWRKMSQLEKSNKKPETRRMPVSQRMLELGRPWEIKQSNPEETEAMEESNHINRSHNYRELKACSLCQSLLSALHGV